MEPIILKDRKFMKVGNTVTILVNKAYFTTGLLDLDGFYDVTIKPTERHFPR